MVVELESGAQDSFSDTTVPWTGRFRLETGVLGEASTLKVYVCPPSTVTVTVHASADAIGETAVNIATRVVPRTAVKNSNFPLLGNLQRSPIGDQRRAHHQNAAATRQPGADGSYWLVGLFAMPNRSLRSQLYTSMPTSRAPKEQRHADPGCALQKNAILITKR